MDPFLGQIYIFAGNFAPRGWALCEGQLLPINSNQSLFSLLGTVYGGDGRTTFGLPDLRGRAPIHEGDGPGLTPRALGSKSGVESVVLTTIQIPSHTHPVSASSAAQLRGYTGADADVNTPGPAAVLGKLQSPVGINAYSNSDANLVDLGGVTGTPEIGNTGGNQGHENRQPFLALNYIIAVQGTFPSRN